MTDQEFDSFLAEWREEVWSDSYDPAFMSTYFAKRKEQYSFSEAQLQKLMAFIIGQELKKVILAVGDTKLSQSVYVALAPASKAIAEVKVSYPLSPTLQKEFQDNYPKITLNSLFSIDQNVIVEVDHNKLILNSSHALKNPTTSPTTNGYSSEHIHDVLKHSIEKLQELSSNNQRLACSIKSFLEKKPHQAAIIDFTNKLCLEVFGGKPPVGKEDDYCTSWGLERIRAGLTVDAKKYAEWVKVFTVIGNPLFIQPQRQIHIDKIILLFADFIILSQSETHEINKLGEHSLNTQELKELREILTNLSKHVVSPHYRLATQLVNGTNLSISNLELGKISCCITLENERMGHLLTLLINKMTLTQTPQERSILINLLRQTHDFVQSFAGLTKAKQLHGTPLCSYMSLNHRIGPIYDSCLKIIPLLQMAGMTEEVFATCIPQHVPSDLFDINQCKLSAYTELELAEIERLCKECAFNLASSSTQITPKKDLNRYIRQMVLPHMAIKESQSSSSAAPPQQTGFDPSFFNKPKAQQTGARHTSTIQRINQVVSTSQHQSVIPLSVDDPSSLPTPGGQRQ